MFVRSVRYRFSLSRRYVTDVPNLRVDNDRLFPAISEFRYVSRFLQTFFRPSFDVLGFFYPISKTYRFFWSERSNDIRDVFMGRYL